LPRLYADARTSAQVSVLPTRRKEAIMFKSLSVAGVALMTSLAIAAPRATDAQTAVTSHTTSYSSTSTTSQAPTLAAPTMPRAHRVHKVRHVRHRHVRRRHSTSASASDRTADTAVPGAVNPGRGADAGNAGVATSASPTMGGGMSSSSQ
jgi:hypothetical protein